MQYGFLIDHRRCIGCHACTVACKSENEVPVGSFRTWVKYTEVGTFPSVKRNFAVLRCNHCTDAPCVTICPVTALDKRPDGIVDIDRDACIGCRACMQACPYDAIYLNEDHGAVEKCHFCAHRVEQDLAPACVVVCPEQAIVFGDLQDPETKIADMVRNLDTEVRRPEQKTGPNVHYVGHEPIALKPGEAAKPETFLWSDRPPTKTEAWPESVPVHETARTVLDAGHKVQWGAGVAAYLVTKGVAAGAAVLAPFLAPLGLGSLETTAWPELVALAFTALTCFLLVEDLSRPMRFYRLLTRPNWNSWLVKGGVVLGLFMALCAAAAIAAWAGAEGPLRKLRYVNAGLGLLVAGYTAFLFAQCKGRDLWEGKALLPHLLVQAVLCGAAVATLAAPVGTALPLVLLLSAGLHAAFAAKEAFGSHETANARQAAGFLRTLKLGPMKALRDGLLLVIGGALLSFVFPPLALPAVLVGLALYEWAFVRAGQLPPLS